ncbi:MAG: hypothetical protein IKJ14_06685 [Clostridia bacterium]|jgi:hypothetical protein|nr:hypothetical protein [Clostridia bacterium]
MVQISAKLIKNHKTIKSLTYKNVAEYDPSEFYFHVSEICRRLDIATPIIIKYHSDSYNQFNFVKFKPDDFIDSVSFDVFLLENIDV